MSAWLPDPIGDAVAWLREGGLLAYPTESVWGLGADARRDSALERLRRWKGRAEGAPISILVDEPGALEVLGFDVGRTARALMAAFWPGPLTLVLRCSERFAAGIARQGDGAVGVRCSSHPLAGALARRLRAAGVGPITATSLNPSGAAAARTRAEAAALCGPGAEEPHMLDVDRAEAGGEGESTVLDLASAEPRVLRWGAVDAGQLSGVWPGIAGVAGA